MNVINIKRTKREKVYKWIFNSLIIWSTCFLFLFIGMFIFLFRENITTSVVVISILVFFLFFVLKIKFAMAQKIDGDSLIISASGIKKIKSDNIKYITKLVGINLTYGFGYVISLKQTIGINKYFYFINDPDYAVIKWCKEKGVRMRNFTFDDYLDEKGDSTK